MTTGVALLNFGEPAEPTRETVVPYLQRIFEANASLEQADSDEEATERARELAERRASGLIEEYETIGGSPLISQARGQADALAAALDARGYDAKTYTGMQFTEPTIDDAVEAARADDVDRLVGLPVYPLCGPSTTVQALRTMAEAVTALEWEVPVGEVTGWHRHPTYNRLRADAIRKTVADADLDLTDPDTVLVFSAHGTPTKYLDSGSRYDRYVEEYCETQARLLSAPAYRIGFQNHENRDIPWTEPEVEDVVAGLDDAERVVVDPVSFMHEQSETLSELDDDLRETAEEAGLDFHRVPVPHDDERFADVLADLVEPFAAGFDPSYYRLQPCRCRSADGAVCLNADPTTR